MRVLSCAEARDLASDMLDGDLTKAEEAAVEAHVANCGTCPNLYRAMVALHEQLTIRRLAGLGLGTRSGR